MPSYIVSGRRQETRAPATEKKPLSLGELEPLASAFLAVLLALVFPRIAGQKTSFLQRTTQFGVELNQCPGNTQLNCPGLTGYTAAVGENQQIETVSHFDRQERHSHRNTTRFGREIVFQFPAIDRDFARSGPQEHAGNATFATPGPQILLYLS